MLTGPWISSKDRRPFLDLPRSKKKTYVIRDFDVARDDVVILGGKIEVLHVDREILVDLFSDN